MINKVVWVAYCSSGFSVNSSHSQIYSENSKKPLDIFRTPLCNCTLGSSTSKLGASTRSRVQHRKNLITTAMFMPMPITPPFRVADYAPWPAGVAGHILHDALAQSRRSQQRFSTGSRTTSSERVPGISAL